MGWEDRKHQIEAFLAMIDAAVMRSGIEREEWLEQNPEARYVIESLWAIVGGETPNKAFDYSRGGRPVRNDDRDYRIAKDYLARAKDGLCQAAILLELSKKWHLSESTIKRIWLNNRDFL